MRRIPFPAVLLGIVVLVLVVWMVVEQGGATGQGAPAVVVPVAPSPRLGDGSATPTATPAREVIQPPVVLDLPDKPTERRFLALREGWLFTKGDAHLAKEPIETDPPSWQPVAVPHSWNVADGHDGGGYYRGIGWYRCWFELPESEAGRSVFIHFAGANMESSVYVNGQWVGDHSGGFAAFAFNITAWVKPGGRNLIAVKVTNAKNLGIPPIYADFTFAGGIYRPVTVATTSPVHLEIGRDGWLGLQLDQRSVTAQVAEVDARLALVNDTRTPVTAEVQLDVQDAAGQVVVSTRIPVELPAMSSAAASVPLRITAPRRWHGLKDPYLYQAAATVRVNGVVVDQVVRSLGLRSFRIDPDQGFLLNEQPYDLHGVGLHQDRLGKGWLISSEDRREDVALLKELGATFVRLAHYQHEQETYDLMDRAGIVVWAELPVLMQVGRGERFAPSAKAQLTGLIRQNAHHPSIVCWGLYNEIGSQPEDVALIRELHALAKRLDPTRPTTAATYAADAAEVNHVTDVIAFNKYFGWFLPNIDAYGPWADQFHAKYPGRAVGITEYGAGGSIRRHEEDPKPPLPGLAKVLPTSHSESYHTLFHQTVWPQLAARKFLWCKSAWVLCDFTSDEQSTGDVPGYTDMGLVTGDRKVRKDAFYYYKAQWSEQPVLHITNRRFTERQPRIDLTVFSNQAQVQVWVNGKELPPVEGAGRVFTWKGVELRRGENRVEASAPGPTGMLRDEVSWRVRQ